MTSGDEQLPSTGQATVCPPGGYPPAAPPGRTPPVVPNQGLPLDRQTMRPKRSTFKCFNCSGWRHVRRNCPSGTDVLPRGRQGGRPSRRGRGCHRGGHPSSSGSKITNISLKIF